MFEVIMARYASDDLVPVNMQPGRIEDFLEGVREAHEANTKAALMGLAGLALPYAWSAFRKYTRP